MKGAPVTGKVSGRYFRNTFEVKTRITLHSQEVLLKRGVTTFRTRGKYHVGHRVGVVSTDVEMRSRRVRGGRS